MKKFLLRRIGVTDGYANTRPSLQACIEIVLQQADTLIGDVLEGLAASSAKPTVKGSFGGQAGASKELIDTLCAQSDEIKETFKAQLREAVYNAGSIDFAEQAQVHFEDLQLFDSKQIDASIHLALAQQEVARCVEDVLPALNALISSLLGWISVQPHLNPIKPEAFVRALQACLLQYVPDERARSALIAPAAGRLGVGLHQLYREVCHWLRSQGVEPATPVGSPVGGTRSGGKRAESSIGRTIVTLDKLRRLLTGEFDYAMGGAGLQDFLNTVPASFVALEDMKLVEPMMKRLAKRASLAPDVKAKAPARQTAREPTQSKLMGKQLGEEVVRMMIDNLMQDERLLPEVRTLIKSLEPVLLALAQSDPQFFSERRHPARQFLDQLTHRSLGFSAESDEGCSLFLKSVSESVQSLLRSAGDAAAFSRLLGELEAGWAQVEAAQRQQHEEAARALLRAEQRNLLAQSLADDFLERQQGKDVPELVSGFLRGPWAQVVAQSKLDCVDGRDDPDGYLALVDDLIWSVQPRRTRHKRRRLVQMVPDLLVRLRQGLQLIGYPEERIPVFFDALISIHEKAFEGRRMQALDRPADELPQPGEASARDGQPETDETMQADGFWLADDEAELSGYLADDGETLPPTPQRPWSAGDLNPGVWVELQVKGAWLRAQLTWASPHRTLFMFVSRGGLAHAMSRRTMERLQMKGSIRLVSDAHVLDSALDAVAQTALQNDLGQVALP
jgi:hypothetical protein